MQEKQGTEGEISASVVSQHCSSERGGPVCSETFLDRTSSSNMEFQPREEKARKHDPHANR